ncbi:MAG: hypothetical protein KBF23_04275 [Agitococcus sp.]|jgi:hypothetical protein|nr:CopG family transcriptional regulator [Moraxellaceae bacterium]MBP9216364.1 hypothetical protein [Agitococcus sp.]MBK7300387.1 CopG family transcriptional regulator [Moraxellaceae bacterium]MBK8326567.1 CopG family transcriptional regulator [Moraxellaceae bacterium]MBK9186044.1 CopG family transcriptional regulator [Moraxellaceae bacterium]
MRTTLVIDDDVLAIAKAFAQQQHKTIGQVISEFARQALTRQAQPVLERNGIPLLKSKPLVAPQPVSLELVNQLRDELP